jgi:hypothetical protein
MSRHFLGSCDKVQIRGVDIGVAKHRIFRQCGESSHDACFPRSTFSTNHDQFVHGIPFFPTVISWRPLPWRPSTAIPA